MLSRTVATDVRMRRSRNDYAERGVTVELSDEPGPGLKWPKTKGGRVPPRHGRPDRAASARRAGGPGHANEELGSGLDRGREADFAAEVLLAEELHAVGA